MKEGEEFQTIEIPNVNEESPQAYENCIIHEFIIHELPPVQSMEDPPIKQRNDQPTPLPLKHRQDKIRLKTKNNMPEGVSNYWKRTAASKISASKKSHKKESPKIPARKRRQNFRQKSRKKSITKNEVPLKHEPPTTAKQRGTKICRLQKKATSKYPDTEQRASKIATPILSTPQCAQSRNSQCKVDQNRNIQPKTQRKSHIPTPKSVPSSIDEKSDENHWDVAINNLIREIKTKISNFINEKGLEVFKLKEILNTIAGVKLGGSLGKGDSLDGYSDADIVFMIKLQH